MSNDRNVINVLSSEGNVVWFATNVINQASLFYPGLGRGISWFELTMINQKSPLYREHKH